MNQEKEEGGNKNWGKQAKRLRKGNRSKKKKDINYKWKYMTQKSLIYKQTLNRLR